MQGTSSFSQETTEQNETVCIFALLFRYCNTVPFFHRGKLNKTNSVFLYHCSVLHLCSVSSTRNNRTKRNSVCFCTTVPCIGTAVPFFALLFRFFHNGTMCFLYHCSVFFALLFRFFHNGTVCFWFTVPFLNFCSVFLYHCSVFCTTVPFFHNGTKNRTVCF